MDYDERENNPVDYYGESIERLHCSCCGVALTDAECDDPMKVKRPIPGTTFHVEEIVCDKCASDIIHIESN